MGSINWDYYKEYVAHSHEYVDDLSLEQAHALAEFVKREMDTSECILTDTKVNHVDGKPFGGLLVAAAFDKVALQKEIAYLMDTFMRNDLVTLTEAAQLAGVSTQAIKAGVRNFKNPAAPNPQRGAVLVSRSDVVERWGRRDEEI